MIYEFILCYVTKNIIYIFNISSQFFLLPHQHKIHICIICIYREMHSLDWLCIQLYNILLYAATSKYFQCIYIITIFHIKYILQIFSPTNECKKTKNNNKILQIDIQYNINTVIHYIRYICNITKIKYDLIYHDN